MAAFLRRRFLALLAVVLAGAAVYAAAMINGTNRGKVIRGTSDPEEAIYRHGANDRFLGLGGAPTAGSRTSGTGQPHGVPAARALSSPNSGSEARLQGSPKIVTRRISRAVGDIGGQAQAEVEPDSFSWGRTIVAAFQVGRYVDGGAAAIGWARSRNGRTWRNGLLPGLRPGHNDDVRVSDPVVAYDARHGMWLVATLRARGSGDDLLISRSPGGLTWRQPVVAARAGGDAFDKPWLACDNGRVSRFRGHCYLSYWNVRVGVIETRTSANGGVTWSQPVALAGAELAEGQVNGAQPVVRPDGTLVVVYISYINGFADVILAARSVDGGSTFAAPVVAAKVDERDVYSMRAPLLPSADVDAGGRIYVAWHECGLRSDCEGDDIVLTTSADGVTWSSVRRVPAALGFPADSDYFTPALAVRPGTSGGRTHVAITYYLMRPPCALDACGIDAGIVESTNGGATWRVPQRLNARQMPLSWIADGGFGRMLADYISTSWWDGRPVAVYALASQPRGEQFRQSILAARPPTPAVRKR